MTFTTVEKTVLAKIVEDSGWFVSSENDNQLLCCNSYFSESAIVKKLADVSFGLSFNKEINAPDFLNEVKNMPVVDGFYSFSLQNLWSAENILKRAAELFASMPDNPLAQYQKQMQKFSDTEIQKTEAERIVKERVGQDIYRDALLKYWQGACSVTGCTLNEALRASHAKPWAECASDAERLNVYNGFLLTANLDALFDKGYISFTDEGLVMISSKLEHSDCKGLGLSTDLKLRWVEKQHLEFLDYHRKNIWKN